MARISDLLQAARDGTLTISECLSVLTSSEGVAASALWGASGHPLQHSHANASGEGRRLDDGFHFRGPLPIDKQLQGGPNVGQFKAAIKVESDGSFTPKSNTFHSQFVDDHQAAMCLKLALQSRAGIEALVLLSNSPRVSTTVTFGMPGGTKYLNREAHLVAAGRPTSNIVSEQDILSNDNFVLIDRRDMGSVVAILRAKESPIGHLHVQTLYPSGDPKSPGGSRLEVTAKNPADYGGPAALEFN